MSYLRIIISAISNQSTAGRISVAEIWHLSDLSISCLSFSAASHRPLEKASIVGFFFWRPRRPVKIRGKKQFSCQVVQRRIPASLTGSKTPNEPPDKFGSNTFVSVLLRHHNLASPSLTGSKTPNEPPDKSGSNTFVSVLLRTHNLASPSMHRAFSPSAHVGKCSQPSPNGPSFSLNAQDP